MPSHQFLLLTIFASLQLLTQSVLGNGYHYNPPGANNAINTGHTFTPLSTVLPLPPVPALPALPTPRSGAQSIASSYLAPQSTPVKYYTANSAPAQPTRQTVQQYQPQQQHQRQQQQQQRPVLTQFTQSYQPVQQQQQQQRPALLLHAPIAFGQRISVPSTTATFPSFAPRASPTATFAPTAGGFVSTAPSAPSAPSAPATPAQAPPQPLRIPFGKAAVITLPTAGANDDFYVGPKGRQLKQYAVIEIIDNDIEQSMEPFLPSGYFESARAQIGASGTGATVDTGTVRFDSRSNALVQEQQRLSAQPVGAASSNAISLGSGGLGYVRLANGNVYLGSGSLGYISGQQHQQLIQEARTRTGASQPDALHFGHGPLGGTGNGFNFRFK